MPRFTVALALAAIVVPIAGVRVLIGSAPDVVGEAAAATPTPIEAPPPADEGVVRVIEPEPTAVSLTPDVTVIGASGEQQLAVDDAVTRFRSAGLELPDVEIHFLADEAECDGHLGLFQRGFTPWRVLVCSDLAFVPTHELAHAWEAANLDDDDRERYVEARDMLTWDDRDANWNERGIEDAAFIVQQILMANHPNLDSPAWRERTAAYELLTGSSPPLGDPGARRPTNDGLRSWCCAGCTHGGVTTPTERTGWNAAPSTPPRSCPADSSLADAFEQLTDPTVPATELGLGELARVRDQMLALLGAQPGGELRVVELDVGADRGVVRFDVVVEGDVTIIPGIEFVFERTSSDERWIVSAGSFCVVARGVGLACP